jgi:FkbM family methyltransferase
MSPFSWLKKKKVAPKPEGFVIYGSMRTGSNYLVSLLNQFPGIVCHGEAFNPAFVGLRDDYYRMLAITREETTKRDRDVHEFYDRILDGQNQSNLCGFKLFPGHNEDILQRTLATRSLRKIVLKRDILTSFISLSQAQASGVWMIKDSNAAIKLRAQERSDVRIVFDGPKFLQYCQRIRDFYRRVERHLSSQAECFLSLWYKDLTRHDTIIKLADFLGRSAPTTVDETALLAKQNHSAPYERVANLEEMLLFLESRGFRSPVVSSSWDYLLAKEKAEFSLNGVLLDLAHPALTPEMRKRIRSGRYEVQESRCVQALIQTGDVVLELGGGIGYISSLAWKTGKARRIIVVEANPDTIPAIDATHRLNGVEATILQGVAGSNCSIGSTAPFYVRSNFWASSLSPEPWGYQRKVEVPCFDFQSLLQTYQPTLLICDIEGGEVDLICGTESLLSVTRIILELHEAVTGKQAVDKLKHQLENQGFRVEPAVSGAAVVVFSR